jgi:hypothetical protein
MNVLESFQTILNWSKDHGLACVSETYEQPPSIPAKKKGKSAVKDTPSTSPGLYLTLCEGSGKKMAILLPAHGAKKVWSVAFDKDGTNYIAGTVDFINQGELVTFLNKEASEMLRAA